MLFYEEVQGVPKKYSILFHHNVLTNEAVVTRITSLDERKIELDFDVLQFHMAEKLTKILMFKLGCIFLDVSEISENRHVK